jgi:hypothetical protein
MKNQVEALRGYGVKVHILSSETTFPERQEVGFWGILDLRSGRLAGFFQAPWADIIIAFLFSAR